MKWWSFWPESLIALVIVSLEAYSWTKPTNTIKPSLKNKPWSTDRKLHTRERVRDLWYHGYDHYMNYAFPYDELSPLSCTGRGPDWDNPHNIASNDVSGNFSLTLIDVLDTLVTLNDTSGFETAVRNTIDWVSFDVNTRPQVFETTIRVLGGLLSGHIYATREGPFLLPWYRDCHGITICKIHLRKGVLPGETTETCVAGAGSLILEFATLSRLSGDDRFEKAAYKAFFALWNRKSAIGLVGNTINTATGSWNQPEVTGIGAGIDSFFEYALKWYILSGEVEFLDVWDESYAAMMRYARAPDGFWYRSVNMHNGGVAYYTVDSLSAFWPGLQVLGGDIRNAIKSHLMYWNIWRKYSGLPEVFDTNFKTATSLHYPLRPEFIESTWYLYRATRDPFYLDVGERILNDLIYRSRVDCGLTGVKDLKSNARDDRMESFALSETLKYLYLLFDEENPINSEDSNYVFTTEGHILILDPKYLRPTSAARRKIRGAERHQCPAYRTFYPYESLEEGDLVQGVRGHPYFDYARHQVSVTPESADKKLWSPYGWCEKPHYELYTYDFILSATGKAVAEDLKPSTRKVEPVSDGYIVHNVTGLRTHIVRRIDDKGYDITKLGPINIRSGQLVYINDTDIVMGSPDDKATKKDERQLTLPLRFFIHPLEDTSPNQVNILDTLSDLQVDVVAHTALFAADLGRPPSEDSKRPEKQRFGADHGSRVLHDPENPLGCHPYQYTYTDEDTVLLVRRGECNFLEKLVQGKKAGAVGVIVISDENIAINPTASDDELKAAGDVRDVALLLLKATEATAVLELIELAAGEGQIMVELDPERRPAMPDKVKQVQESREKGKLLYLNGHALVNTRLVF